MSIPAVPRRARLVRAGAVAVAVLASSALGMPTAVAASALTIPLLPDEVGVFLYPVENTGPMTPDMEPEEIPFTPVDVEWGGQVVVEIPAPLDGSAMDVDLALAPTEDDEATRTYSTTTPGPDELVVTDLGDGQYGIQLPADDAVNGPSGRLMLTNFTGPGAGIETVGAVDYLLEFTGTGVAVRSLAPQMMVIASVPCPLSSMTRCPAIPVDAGAQFGITVPPGSLLRTLGLGTLDDMLLTLDALDTDGFATGAETIVLSDDPALVTVSDSYNATVTLPASTPGGAYGLTLVQATGTAGAISVTFGELEVTGVPVVPRIVNAGLRSDTGWGEGDAAVPDAGVSPLVGIGTAMMLSAGAGAAVVLRRRAAGN